MPRSLKVCQSCIGSVKRALKKQGFLSQRALSEELGLALSTVSNFLNAKPVDRAVFEEICLALRLDWQAIAAPIEAENPAAATTASERSTIAAPQLCQDWGEAPASSIFYGRAEELAQLEQWMIHDQYRVILMLGMGGTGKTALSVQLLEQMGDRFDAFIWRTLRNAPPLQTLLADLILSLSQQQASLPERLESQLEWILKFLRQHRCLLVLDNVESILQSGEPTGLYRPGYEPYDELFCRIADERHHSCLVLTSREGLKSLSPRMEDPQAVRLLSLQGLPLAQGQQLLAAGGLTDSQQSLQHLTEVYGGNPLALKIVTSTIRSTFAGNVSRFLQQQVVAYGGIWDLLHQQFNRLSQLEQQVMYWLAIHREWISFEDLRAEWIPSVAQRQLLDAIESLQRRSLIEVSRTGFTQQSVVMEYVTQQLIDSCHDEMTTQTLNLLKSHALLKAEIQDYIRDTQARLILQPLIQKLLVTYTDSTGVAFVLNQLLELLRGKPLSYTGYAAGNLINLINALEQDLSDRDFSNLAIAQAYLADSTLQRTNFTGSTLYQSSFMEVFGGVIAVAFSPDGTQVAVSDTRRDIHLWHLPSQQKRLTLKGHNSWVFSFVFSPSGKTLASASDDYVVKLWDLETGQCLQTLKGPANLRNAVNFSPDEQRIQLKPETLAIQLWNVEHPDQQIASLQGYTLLARSTVFSPDGKAIALSTQDQTLKIWNIHTGECVQTLSVDTPLIKVIQFSCNGYYLASASPNHEIQLWDVRSGECLHTLKGHTQSISEIAFSPDDRYLASSSFDRTVRVWDVETGECLKTLHGHHKPLMTCAFSPDGQYLLSGGGDQSVKLWDVETGQCLKSLQGYANGVTAIALNHNSAEPQILASAYQDKTIKLWDLATGSIITTLPIQSDLVWGLTFAPDNRSILASASADHTVKLWNWQTGECLQTLRHQSWAWSAAFHPSGVLLATGSYDQTIKLWNPHTGECIRTLQGHISAVMSVAFSPDGAYLASCSHDKTIRIWQVETGKCVRVLEGHGDRVWQVQFSADAQSLASCSYDATLKLWNLDTGECLRTLSGHAGAVTGVCFGPTCQTLISSSFDQTIKVWDIPTGTCLQTLQGHTQSILCLVSQPEPPLLESDRNTLIISGGSDALINLWHLETGTCIRSLIAPRPYEGMNITDISGLTDAQQTTLKLLGAIAL